MFFLVMLQMLVNTDRIEKVLSPHSVLIAHFGDRDSSIHPPGYLSDSQFIPDQNEDFLAKVEALHEQHR